MQAALHKEKFRAELEDGRGKQELLRRERHQAHQVTTRNEAAS